MSAPELSRPVKPRALPAEPLTIEANDAERAALADRFAVTAIATTNSSTETRIIRSGRRRCGQVR